jgi:hypothetical protein
LFTERAPCCRSADLTQGNRIVRFGVPDGPVFVTLDVGPAFFVFDHEDVEGGLGASLRLAPLILLPLAVLWTFWLDHLQWPFLSYDNLLALGGLGLRWLNQDLPIELDHVHVCRKQVLVELHLVTFCKFQSSFVYG